MGFRSVRDFNIALLGNQGWRLIQYPEKLVSRIYKARYYPQGNFLNAKIGSNPSFIWWSFHESQSVIRKGIGCRVGNGMSINIKDDPWLPEIDDATIQTKSDAIRNQKVSSLISMADNSWDTDLILDVFNSRDANIILSIPMDKEVNDSWYWRYGKFVNYSVKSAYLLQQGDRNDNNTSANSDFWRNLWNLKIPPKIKSFLWRASTNCLPTRDMLLTKRVPVIITCPVCNEYPESCLHIFTQCAYAESVWGKLNISFDLGNINSFSEWLDWVFQHYSKEKVLDIVMVCWIL